jgi:hypothetical protein
MLKKIAIAFGVVIAALVLAVGALYAKGGRAEVLLWFVKVFVRVEHGPNREVTWAIPSGKSTIPENSSGVKPPNVILIVADDLGFNDITLNGGGLAKGTVPLARPPPFKLMSL